MSTAVAQTFQLIATFDIALISISIAVYAISASYLGREVRLARSRMEKKKQELTINLNERLTRLSEMGKRRSQIQIEDLARENKQEGDKIEKAKNEISNYTDRIFILSWRGAVLVPVLIFGFSIIFSIVGMNLFPNAQFENTDFKLFIFASPFTLFVGLAWLLVVIKIIDSAARNVPIPKFTIYFEGKDESIRVKPKQDLDLVLYVENQGDDIAKDVSISIVFPVGFKVQPRTSYKVVLQGKESDYPDCEVIVFRLDRINPNAMTKLHISIITPEDKKKYLLAVTICDEKTGESEKSLEIEVIN
jgi:hypothetical protein